MSTSPALQPVKFTVERVSPESIERVVETVTPLVHENLAEVTPQHGQTFAPAAIASYVRAGVMRAYLARIDGRSCGYALVWVSVHPHHNELHGNLSTIFLTKGVRKGTRARTVLRFIEADLAADDVKCLHAAAPVDTRAARLFAVLGYAPTEQMFTRML